MSKQCHWGILGAGLISSDFANAVNDPAGPAAELNKIIAVAARDLDRAKAFAEVHSISTAYGDYRSLAENPSIDIVYVGNTIAHHYDAVKMLLEGNKHVLCEKSFTTNVEQAKELFELARSKNLFLMEAVWSNFFPTYKKIQEVIKSGVIGEVLHVEASFGKKADHRLRIYSVDLGGGAARDLGIYTINLIRLAFQNEEPQRIITYGDLFKTGVDSSWDAVLAFSNNRRAVAKCSVRYLLDSNARITGSKGVIEIPDPMNCPTDILVNGEKFSIELPSKPVTKYNYLNAAGLAYQAVAVCQALSEGKLECEEYTAVDSIYIHKILAEIIRQLEDNAEKHVEPRTLD